MQPAFDRVVVYLALGQRHLRMRADVEQGEDLIARAHDGRRGAVQLHAHDTFVWQVRHGTHPHECGKIRHDGDPGRADGSSSASTASVTRARRLATSILSINSPKKPLITSRLASLYGMPRAIRYKRCISSSLPLALARPAPITSPVRISRFGTESTRAPSVRTRLRLYS